MYLRAQSSGIDSYATLPEVRSTRATRSANPPNATIVPPPRRDTVYPVGRRRDVPRCRPGEASVHHHLRRVARSERIDYTRTVLSQPEQDKSVYRGATD